MVIDLRDEQDSNAPRPQEVIEVGRLIFTRDEQSKNEESEIQIIASGITTVCNKRKPLNAESPMIVKELGMVQYF